MINPEFVDCSRSNRYVVGLILTLLLATLACGQATAVSTAPPLSTIAPVADILFTDGPFQVLLPPWFDQPLPDEQTLRLVGAGDGRIIAVARDPGVPRLVGRHLADILPETGVFHNLALIEDGPSPVTLTADLAGDVPQQAEMHLVYCNGHTYRLTAASAAVDLETLQRDWQRVLASITCENAPRRAPADADLIGISINPAGGDYEWPALRQALVTAYDGGARATHISLNWSEIEGEPGVYDWTIGDYLLDSLTLEGLRTTLVLPFIFTSVPGPAPADLVERSFADPLYQTRAIAYTTAVLNRYGDQIDALFIGNEVNIYLAEHPEDVDSFRQLFDAVRTAVAQSHPHIPVGTTLAFHTAQQQNRFDLITAFGDTDLYGFTYYPFEDDFQFTADPAIFGATLDEMARVAGATPFIIVENGWATAPSLGGDELSQAAYLQATLDALAARPGFDRHIWYGLHDGRPDQCALAALAFFPPDFDPATLGPAGDRFEDYLCTLGLRHVDGTPKIAWHVFTTAAPQWLAP